MSTNTILFAMAFAVIGGVLIGVPLTVFLNMMSTKPRKVK